MVALVFADVVVVVELVGVVVVVMVIVAVTFYELNDDL